ncbi:MAG: hypothetical protein HYY49_05115 [Ignavibacteriales bacterium]|nr:hypothetical protein [Ignavibacteriales bacterium]
MNKFSYRLRMIVIASVLVSCNLRSQKKVSYDGYVSTGVKIEYKGFAESFYRAKIQLEVKINDFIEAQADLRGQSGSREVELREVSGEFRYWNKTRLKVGNLKKRFGMEELVAREQLYTVQRSLINRHISPMGYVGRDVGVQLYKKWMDGDNDNYSYYAGISYNESRAFGANGRISVHDVLGFSHLGLDAVYAKLKGELIFGDPLDAFAVSADMSKKIGQYVSEAEIFIGKDPLQTKISGFVGDRRSVYFGAVRTLHVYRVDLDEKTVKAIEPVILLSFLAPDTRDVDVNQLQMLIGFNIYFDEDVRLLVNGDLILSNSRFNKDDRFYTGSTVIAELQFRW